VTKRTRTANALEAPPLTARTPESRVDRAYRYVKTLIVSAGATPGTALSEQQIAKTLGVSRTPVREAIRKLEQEGLVIRHAHKGVLVPQLAMRDILEIWQIREILEPVACRIAVGRIDTLRLAAVEKAMLKLQTREPRLEDYEGHHKTDLELHQLILQGSGNATLGRVLAMLNARVATARMVTSRARYYDSLREHLEIVAALKAGNDIGAADAMRRHLVNAREGQVRAVLDNLTSDTLGTTSAAGVVHPA
jgi:DNA-binding GntR family transcriptional regulator